MPGSGQLVPSSSLRTVAFSMLESSMGFTMAWPVPPSNAPREHGYLAYARLCELFCRHRSLFVDIRRRFLDLGGFNEAEFGVAYNDVDYCYRLVDPDIDAFTTPTRNSCTMRVIQEDSVTILLRLLRLNCRSTNGGRTLV